MKKKIGQQLIALLLISSFTIGVYVSAEAKKYQPVATAKAEIIKSAEELTFVPFINDSQVWIEVNQPLGFFDFVYPLHAGITLEIREVANSPPVNGY